MSFWEWLADWWMGIKAPIKFKSPINRDILIVFVANMRGMCGSHTQYPLLNWGEELVYDKGVNMVLDELEIIIQRSEKCQD